MPNDLWYSLVSLVALAVILLLIWFRLGSILAELKAFNRGAESWRMELSKGVGDLESEVQTIGAAVGDFEMLQTICRIGRPSISLRRRN